MSKLGRVTEWNDERGYGFLVPTDGGPRVFVHIKSFSRSTRRPELGEWLRYAEARDPKGRLRADSISFVAGKSRGSADSKSSRKYFLMRRNGLMILGLGLLLVVIVLMLTGLFPDYLAFLVLGMSAATFMVYALDKTAAEKGRWRTPENTLHVLSLLGGWPGALIAQQGFRHKNRKMPFQALFWLTVVVNLALVWFLVAEDGLKGLL